MSSNSTKRPPKDELIYYHHKQLKTKRQIAEQYDVSRRTIKRWFDHYGLEFLGNSKKRMEMECKKYIKEVRKWMEHTYGMSPYPSYEPSTEDLKFYRDLESENANTNDESYNEGKAFIEALTTEFADPHSK